MVDRIFMTLESSHIIDYSFAKVSSFKKLELNKFKARFHFANRFH